MNTYEVTIGTINCGISGNEFVSGPESRAIRAKTRAGAARAALKTKANITTEHDIDHVFAVDRDFGPDGICKSGIRAVLVVEAKNEN